MIHSDEVCNIRISHTFLSTWKLIYSLLTYCICRTSDCLNCSLSYLFSHKNLKYISDIPRLEGYSWLLLRYLHIVQFGFRSVHLVYHSFPSRGIHKSRPYKYNLLALHYRYKKNDYCQKKFYGIVAINFSISKFFYV